MLIETERLLITEFTMDMAQVVQENSVDEDNRRFVPDEVWETVEETEETLKFLISQYGTFESPLVYPVITKQAGISEIYGICLAENTASLAVMQKCDFENVFTGIGLYQGGEREIIKKIWRVKV